MSNPENLHQRKQNIFRYCELASVAVQGDRVLSVEQKKEMEALRLGLDIPHEEIIRLGIEFALESL
jgi:hypothetical protein